MLLYLINNGHFKRFTVISLLTFFLFVVRLLKI
nr:MAG TPA: hypothetical protein [Caudoviricetes sp.]